MAKTKGKNEAVAEESNFIEELALADEPVLEEVADAPVEAPAMDNVLDLQEPAPAEPSLDEAPLEEPVAEAEIPAPVEPAPVEPAPVEPVLEEVAAPAPAEEPAPAPVEAPAPAPVEEEAKKGKEEKAKKSKKSKKQSSKSLYGFTLAQGENFVKDYNLVNTGRSGLAIFTNKRFILKSTYTIETDIKNVEAFRSCKYTQFKAFKFIFGLIFMGACAAAFVLKFDIPLWAKYTIMGVGALLGILGLLMVCTSIKRKFSVSVFTRDLTEIVTCHSSLNKREAQNFVQVIEGVPGKEFAAFTKEAGALLLDIKSGLYD